MRIYRRPDSPHWQYSFTVHGRRFRGSTRREGKREATLEAARIYETAAAQRSVNDEWRLREALGAYYNDKGQYRASADQIFSIFERISDFLGRDLLITDITTARLLDYRAHARGQTGAKLHTINRHYAMLKAALNHAAQVYGKPVPAIAWKGLGQKEPPGRIRFASAAEYAALLNAAHSELRPIIMFAVATGLRRSKIAQLQWHQVDMANGLITIPRQKSGKAHVVEISGATLDAVRRLHVEAIGHGQIATLPRGPVFNMTNFRRRWHRAVADAGLVDFRFHDLRHTFATYARLGGADLLGLREAMDHSSVTVTQRYAHIVAGNEVSVFKRVNSLIIGTNSGTDPEKMAKKSQK